MNQVNQHGTKKLAEMAETVSAEEALSALMDGELEEFELRRLLARISERPDLLATWERYNLARAAFQPEPLQFESLRSRQDVMMPDQLANRIMAAIAAEPQLHAGISGASESTAATSRWSGNLARLAVAASVAVAVFVGMQTLLDQPSAPMVADVDSATENPVSMQVAGEQIMVDPEAQQRLNDYIRGVTIPGREEPVSQSYNILLESPMLHPVSDRELIQQVERTSP